MASDNQRVNYVEGQRLRATDLQSEQSYLLGLDLRHNLGEHAPGLARGLIRGTDIVGTEVINAGVAIDFQGRELLASTDVPVPGDAAATCLDVWIVYCLVPVRVRQPGRSDCSTGAFQRWREFGQIVTTAGNPPAAPLAPVDGAVYLGRIRCNSSPDLNYVALMGQSVADPGERTFLQVGPTNGRDRNGFVVSTTDSAGVTMPRLAIDRRGKITFWGNLNLLDYFASALLAAPVADALILAQAKNPGAAGEELRARLAPSSTARGTKALDLTFVIAGKNVTQPLTLEGSLSDLKQRLQHFNQTSKLISLSLVPQAPVRTRQKHVRSRADKPLTGQDTSLASSGGNMKLEKWPDPPVQPAVVVRGCTTSVPQDPVRRQANGISFAPPPSPMQGTPLPGASAATVTEDMNPVVQLRLDLGKKKENDPSVRLAMGERAPGPGPIFVELLTGDGNGNLAIPGGGTPTNPSISLNVAGTIEQNPIQPDPTDPRFTNLLVLAWLHGLERSVQASTVVGLQITGEPALIETGKDWSYKVTASNTGSVPVDSDKLFETRLISGQTLLTPVANQTTIAPGGKAEFTINHAAGDMGAATGNLSIEVRMSGKIGNFPWWKAASKGPIPVVESPDLDISGLPASASHNAFSYNFGVTNRVRKKIQLTAVVVTDSAATSQTNFLAGPRDLNLGDTATFTVDHTGGIAADLPVTISVDFTWENGPASNITKNKDISAV